MNCPSGRAAARAWDQWRHGAAGGGGERDPSGEGLLPQLEVPLDGPALDTDRIDELWIEALDVR